MRRRKRVPASPLLEPFERVLDEVERAKAALVRAVPSPRGRPGPLADALAGYEEALTQAREAMEGWRIPDSEEAWQRCLASLDEAGRRAERLRLDAPPLDYESLVYLLDDLMAPLDVFEAVHRLLSP